MNGSIPRLSNLSNKVASAAGGGDAAGNASAAAAAIAAQTSADKGKQKSVIHFAEGQFFGERALLKGQTRFGTVKASTNLDTLVLDAAAFAELELSEKLNFRNVQPLDVVEVLHSKIGKNSAVIVVKAQGTEDKAKTSVFTFVFEACPRVGWRISHVHSHSNLLYDGARARLEHMDETTHPQFRPVINTVKDLILSQASDARKDTSMMCPDYKIVRFNHELAGGDFWKKMAETGEGRLMHCDYMDTVSWPANKDPYI